jgi:hypothetical protein
MFGRNRDRRVGPRGEVLPKQNEGLPDSHLPNGLCPRCGVRSSFEVIGSLPVTYDFTTYYQESGGRVGHDMSDQVSVLMCRNCHQGTVVVEEQWIGDAPRGRGGGGEVSYRGFHWWPLPVETYSADIPAEIASAFAEAVTALAANCPRAAAVMARRTLEAICADKGETDGVLATRLTAMGNRGILTPVLADWAKEVRLVGNTGAHFDAIQQVSIDDARQLTTFIQELLKHIYELPAELARRRSHTL